MTDEIHPHVPYLTIFQTLAMAVDGIKIKRNIPGPDVSPWRKTQG